MTITLGEIADRLGAVCVGDSGYKICRAAAPGAAQAGDLALAMDPKYAEYLIKGAARVAVLWPGADWQALGLVGAIFVPRPRFAMAGITGIFDQPPILPAGHHPSAIIDASAVIGAGSAIGALVVIGPNVTVGINARILPQVTIAEGTTIGADALLYSGVRIGSNVRIGDRFSAHYNAVIGSDGFSYVTPEPDGAEAARADLGAENNADTQVYSRIASTAGVTIGDDVEIGACSTVDKGTVADTVIGSGTKLDNHVQIGHNVRTGENCLLCAHVAIAGSTVLGDQVVLGGQSGVGDHLIIGDHVIAGGASAILSNVPKGRVVMGYPATKMQQSIDSYKALRRLPRLVAKVAALEKRVSKLAKKE